LIDPLDGLAAVERVFYFALVRGFPLSISHRSQPRGILDRETTLAMQSIFIRFVTEVDRTRGFASLAKHSRISSLPGQVYQVPIDALGLLESEHISYRRATDAEVKAANDQVRNPAASVLQ
jgi:hypothetical protein